MVHQANAGLGAARNVGTATRDRRATSPSPTATTWSSPGAYERMVGSLDRTGSDLAIGAVERLRGAETFMTPLMRSNHAAGR